MKYFSLFVLFIAICTSCQKDDSLRVEAEIVDITDDEEETPANLLLGKWTLDYEMLYDDIGNPEAEGERHEDKEGTTVEFMNDGTLIITAYTTETDANGDKTEPTPKEVKYGYHVDGQTIILTDDQDQETSVEITDLTADNLVLEHIDDEGRTTMYYFDRMVSDEGDSEEDTEA